MIIRCQRQKNAVTFNNAYLIPSNRQTFIDEKCTIGSLCTVNNIAGNSTEEGVILGPFVDDGAPYSAIGFIELNLLLSNTSEVILESIPALLASATLWQYGIGEHSSAPRRIPGSYMLCLRSDYRRDVFIKHFVLDGSSQ